MADYSNDFEIRYDEAMSACTVRFRCFDTPNSVTVYGCGMPDGAVEDLLLAVRRLCLEYHALWSFSLPGSDIARINAGSGRIAVSEDTARLLQAMQEFNAREPSFDFTVGPVSFLWKRASAVPAQDDITSALEHVGAGKVTVGRGVVLKDDPLMQVDVGGAAKGFAADAVTAMLREAGVRSADVDLGGNLFMLGEHPKGRAWHVAVRIPEGIPVEPIVLKVRDQSVVTSGSYERFSDIDGTRYTHIIDAATGWPVASDIVSATVVADSSLQADMLATTALIASSEGLPALAARHPACKFLAITREGEVISGSQAKC